MAMSACIHHVVSMSITNQEKNDVKWTSLVMRDVHGSEFEFNVFAENQEEGLALFFGCKEE